MNVFALTGLVLFTVILAVSIDILFFPNPPSRLLKEMGIPALNIILCILFRLTLPAFFQNSLLFSLLCTLISSWGAMHLTELLGYRARTGN